VDCRDPRGRDRLLEYRGFTTEDELEALWSERGDDYFLRERAEDIAWHTEAIANHQDPASRWCWCATASSPASPTPRRSSSTRPSISVPSRAPVRSLEQLDLSVHDARIYHGSDGMSLDTYYVLDAADGLSRTRNACAYHRYLERTLGRSAEPGYRAAPDTAARALVPRGNRNQHAPTSSQNVSVLEVVSLDRPGCWRVSARSSWSTAGHVQAAKIQTLGERVEDVFFITDTQRQPIATGDRQAIDPGAIRDKLDPREAA
jgi:[protein-PII] uridylyltransferase